MQLSGFIETDSLGKYLGVTLHGRSLTQKDYRFVIEQIQEKLTVCKGNQLSFARRLTLSKSVLLDDRPRSIEGE